MNLYWQVRSEHGNDEAPTLSAISRADRALSATLISFRQHFTFDQGILTSAFPLHNTFSSVTTKQCLRWSLQRLSWVDAVLSYSGISSRFDTAVWSLGEGHIYNPLTGEHSKHHTLQKGCGWIQSDRLGVTVVNLSESWFDRTTRDSSAFCLFYPQTF